MTIISDGLLIFLITPLVLCQLGPSISSPMENTTISPVFTASTAEPKETYDYIIKLVFGLENDKVPEFLIKTIYENRNNVTIVDIITLYDLENLNISQTIDILEHLKYNPYSLLSVNGLEKVLNDLSINFKNFYDHVTLNKLNISGVPLRDFLKSFGINTAEFADATTYGDQDPFEVFKKGNFSEGNLQNALQIIGKSKEQVFDACKEEILLAVALKPTENILNILKTYNFDQKQALQVWEILQLTVEDAENVVLFSEWLEELRFSLDNSTYLGILTNNTVLINDVIYQNITEKMKISKLYAQSINETTAVELTIAKSYFKNIVTFNLANDNFTSFAEVATTTKDLQNCLFVTLENDKIIDDEVEKASYKNSYLEVSLDNITVSEFIQGSPLICNNKVYGLAKDIENDNIIFDTFRIHSGASDIFKKLFNFCTLFFSLLVCFKL